MRNTVIFRTVLQVINSAPVLIDVSTVRMPFENHVDVAAEHAVVFVVTIAVVPAVNNDVRAFAPHLLGLGFHQIRQTASSYEINVSDLTCGYRGIAISYCADNADFDSAALHRNRRLTIIRYFARASLSDVDGQKRKIGNCQIVRNLFFAPVELVIAQGHRNEVQFVHPFRHHVAFGKVGFAASLPHISRREHHGIAVCGIALKVSRELVHAGLIRRIEDFPVQIVDGEKIKVNGNHQIAVVAATVVVRVNVTARRLPFDIFHHARIGAVRIFLPVAHGLNPDALAVFKSNGDFVRSDFRAVVDFVRIARSAFYRVPRGNAVFRHADNGRRQGFFLGRRGNVFFTYAVIAVRVFLSVADSLDDYRFVMLKLNESFDGFLFETVVYFVFVSDGPFDCLP